MRIMVKRLFLLAMVVATVAVISGCQTESTTPAPTANTAKTNAAPAGGPLKPPAASQMNTGAEAAPAGVDTSLKGGMK